MRTVYDNTRILQGNLVQSGVVMIGNFDGVHVGHQLLFKRALTLANALKLPVVAYTFRPHPTIELQPEKELRLLMTYEEKTNQLFELGVSRVVEQEFNSNFSKLTAREFFDEIVLKALHAKGLVVGENFRFGNKREGDLILLKQFCAQNQVQLETVPEAIVESEVVSSSKIRELLEKHDLKKAEKFLGRAFFYKGEVVTGDKRGRTIGFPTANMACAQKFPLPIGVYVTSVFWRNRVYPSVTNIGRRPTFTTGLIPIRIETHLLDQDIDLYGEILEVRFHQWIRNEMKFNGIEELRNQIAKDILVARGA